MTVAKWRSRFPRDRLTGLADGPRPGRPRTITGEHVMVIAATLSQDPPAGGDGVTAHGQRRVLLLG